MSNPPATKITFGNNPTTSNYTTNQPTTYYSNINQAVVNGVQNGAFGGDRPATYFKTQNQVGGGQVSGVTGVAGNTIQTQYIENRPPTQAGLITFNNNNNISTQNYQTGATNNTQFNSQVNQNDVIIKQTVERPVYSKTYESAQPTKKLAADVDPSIKSTCCHPCWWILAGLIGLAALTLALLFGLGVIGGKGSGNAAVASGFNGSGVINNQGATTGGNLQGGQTSSSTGSTSTTGSTSSTTSTTTTTSTTGTTSVTPINTGSTSTTTTINGGVAPAPINNYGSSSTSTTTGVTTGSVTPGSIAPIAVSPVVASTSTYTAPSTTYTAPSTTYTAPTTTYTAPTSSSTSYVTGTTSVSPLTVAPTTTVITTPPISTTSTTNSYGTIQPGFINPIAI